jgi:Protein phosphatase 2C
VAGTTHVRAGIGCQDAHRWSVLPNQSLIIAVADGAGSAARSAEGAQVVINAAAAYLVGALRDSIPDDEQAWYAVMRQTFDAAFAGLTAHAADAQLPLRDYAATLTVVAAADGVLAVGQVGDGIAVAEDDGGLFLAAAPQRGEYANEVALLTSQQMVQDAAIAVFPTAVRAVAVTTDGLLRLAVRLPSHAPHAPFFRPLFAFLDETDDLATAGEELSRFLASERVSDRTDDDKTIVLAVRAASNEREEMPTIAPTETPQTG